MRHNKAAISLELRNKLVTPLKANAEQAALELDHHCRFCGRLFIPKVETYQMPLRDKPHQMFIWPDRCGCEAERVGLQAEQIQQELSAAELRAQARHAELNRAGLVGWLAEAEFAQFQPRDDWAMAMECKTRTMAYFDALESNTFEIVNHPIFRPHKKNWLIMHGHYGCGKTLLAAAMVKLYAGPGRAYFRVWPDYERRIRATFSKNEEDKLLLPAETEDSIIRELQTGEFIVIDDLDKSRTTEFTRRVLYSVLNYRYNAELPTVLTFNFGPDELDIKVPGQLVLESILGPAVLDRVIGAAFDVIEFDGPSYRSGVKLGA